MTSEIMGEQHWRSELFLGAYPTETTNFLEFPSKNLDEMELHEEAVC